MILYCLMLIGGVTAKADSGEPSFGNDVSVGYAIGQGWGGPFASERYGNILLRYDAFVRNRTSAGPKMGFGLWGSIGVGPTIEIESFDTAGRMMRQPAPQQHTGILALLRFDPEAPVTGTFGMGFGRLEFNTIGQDSVALPALTIEAGGRHSLPNYTFMDWMLRTHWATVSTAFSQEPEEWWFVELSTSIGMHLR